MASLAMLIKLTLVVHIGLMVVAAPAAEAAMSCGTVAQYLSPCLDYLRSGGAGTVPVPCCSGIKSLNDAAKTTPDRQAVCRCLKSAAAAFSGSTGVAAGVPVKCGVHIPYKIDPATDCNKVE
ncbi:hypothetical protein Ancab_014172 [Ancistrocladus abbreviatus]